jgi:hypothetical protein
MNGASDYQLHINFLPVAGELPPFTIYRRPRIDPREDRPAAEAIALSLPIGSDFDQRQSYWILFEPRDGFQSYEATAAHGLHLNRRALHYSLRQSAARVLSPEQIVVPRNEFVDESDFIMETHPQGNELLVVQPYFLSVNQQLGFLIDFHFRLGENVQFSREVQRLCLTLNHNFRRNLDYCSDRTAKIDSFLKRFRPVLDQLKTPGTGNKIVATDRFVALPADQFRSRVYVFAGGKESRSQFLGLKEHGPLRSLEAAPRLLFVFREQDRDAARLLVRSLQGKNGRGLSFSGFKSLFKSDIDIDRSPIVLPDLSTDSMKKAAEQVSALRNTFPTLLPVIVLPDGEVDGYMDLKSMFTHLEIPTQVCTLRILQDQDSLKWAVGNLALQMFCKAGGLPWKVRPTSERSLIIGISQSHKFKEVDSVRQIDRYFAFSVLTDSSGLFQKVQVLGA